MNPDPASLYRLHDIAVPPPAPWWPPATAWEWLLAFGTLMLALMAARLLARHRANLYRRQALALLASPDTSAVALPEVLKRAALSAYPRESVASLGGEAWLQFLDRTAGTDLFTHGPARRLVTLAYEPPSAEPLTEAERNQLFAAARTWIRNHSAPNE